MDFIERSASMGLIDRGNGIHEYSDRFGSALYRTLHTKEGGDCGNFQIPHMALFTKSPEIDAEYNYIGTVSKRYEFIGNEAYINQVLQSVSDINIEYSQEIYYQNARYTQLYYSLVLRNGQTNPQVGDIFPQITVKNSYDGTRMQTLAFGFYINDNSNNIIFNLRKNLGEMKRKHHESSSTFTIGLSSYIDMFSQSINELVDMNMRKQLTADDIMTTLDELKTQAKLSDPKLKSIASAIPTYNFESNTLENNTVSAWSVFLTILKYTMLEQNINTRCLLENAVEANMILPTNMMVKLL